MLRKTQGYGLEMGGVSLYDKDGGGQNEITWRRPRLKLSLQSSCVKNKAVNFSVA
jgi:hypothetical protein